MHEQRQGSADEGTGLAHNSGRLALRRKSSWLGRRQWRRISQPCRACWAIWALFALSLAKTATPIRIAAASRFDPLDPLERVRSRLAPYDELDLKPV